MRVRPLLLPAALALAAAGCLPRRDNPVDPAIAPAASLKAIDPGFPDGAGACPAVDVATTSYAQVLSVSRGGCVFLDASATHDPQSPPGALDYRYAYLGTAHQLDLALGGGKDVRALLLDSALRATAPVGAVLFFRVDVTDPGGAHESAETELTLTNAPPIARGPAARSFLADGVPWAPGPLSIAFDPSASSDPDGDPLRYCWTFDPALSGGGACAAQPASVCSSDPHDPAFTRCVDGSVHPALSAAARLVVDDGLTSSSQAVAPIRIGPPDVWASASQNVHGWIELDTLRHSFPAFDGGPQVAGIFHRPTGDRIAVYFDDGSGATLETVGWPDGSTPGTPIALSNETTSAISATADGSSVWLLDEAQTQPAPTLALREMHPDATGTTMTPGAVFSGIPEHLNAGRATIRISSTGELWAAEIDDTQVLHVVNDTLQSPITTPPGRIVAGIGLRPGTDELWEITSADWIHGDIGPIELECIAGVCTGESYPIPGSSAGWLEWASDSELWTYVPDRGLELVDLDALRRGDDAHAIALEVADATDVLNQPTIEPTTGALWYADPITIEVVRVDVGGDIIREPATWAGDPTTELVDSAGALWFVDQNGTIGTQWHLREGLTAAQDGVLRTLPHAAFGVGAANDPLDGSLWYSAILPTSLVHAADDGRVLEYRSSVQYAGASTVSAMPFMSLLRLAPGTRTLFGEPIDISAGSVSGLFRFDLSSDPATATQVLDTAQLATLVPMTLYRGTETMFEPSSPVVGVTPFAWSVVDPDGPGAQPTTLVKLGFDGQLLASVFQFPAAEVNNVGGFTYIAARSVRDDSLCVADVEEGGMGAPNRFLHLRRFTSAGARTDLATLALPAYPNYGLDSVAVSSDASRDVCWVAYVDRNPTLAVTHVVGYATANTVWAGDDETAPAQGFEIYSILPTSNTTLWIGGIDTRQLLEFDPNTAAVIRREPFAIPSGEVTEYLSNERH